MAQPRPIGAWLLLAMLGLLACDGGQPELMIGGCDEVRRGPVCVLRDRNTAALSLTLVTYAGAEVRLSSSAGALPVLCDGAKETRSHCIAREAGSVVSVPLSIPPQLAGERLRLTSQAPGLGGSQRVELPIEVVPPLPAWIQKAQALRENDRAPAAAASLIQSQLASPAAAKLSAADRAQAQSELAQAQIELLQLDAAEQTLEALLEHDRQFGLVSGTAEHLLLWFEVLGDRRQFVKMERLLDRHQAAFAQVAEARPWPPIYRAQNALALGDLTRALRYLEEAQQVSQLTANQTAQAVGDRLRSQVFLSLGIVRDDKLIEHAAQDAVTAPCRYGLFLRRQAALRLEILESELGESAEPDEVALERLAALWRGWEGSPVPGPATLLRAHIDRIQALLDKSERGLRNQEDEQLKSAGASQAKREVCGWPRPWAQVALTRARVAALRRQPAELQTALQRVRDTLSPAQQAPESIPSLRVEWSRLQIELALQEGRYPQALTELDQLASYGGEDLGSFEIQWLLNLGRARAWMGIADLGSREKALSALRTADQVIEDASRAAPQLMGRGSLLGRFEGGSQRLLGLLLRIDENGQVGASASERIEALQLVRHLRIRPLLDLRRLEQVQRLDPQRREQWTAAVAAYLEARREHERAQSSSQSGETLQLVRKRLTAALNLLGEPAALPPRRAAEQEVFFACHPVVGRWVCLMGHESRVEAATFSVAQLLRPGLSREGDSELLAPFADLLRGAKQLTVLGYGAARSLAVESLPWAGRPLREVLAVRHSLDLGAASPPVNEPRLLIAVDGKLEYADSRQARVPILAPLTAAVRGSRHWQAEVMTMGLHGVVQGVPLARRTSELINRIPQAGLLLLFGHMDYSPGNGWQSGIHWTSNSRLTGGDILISMPAVPARVLLIACSSGASDDLMGGQESLGVAQAFLLRGSQEVLATLRPVSVEAGSLLSRLLLEHLAMNPGSSLGRALDVILTELSAANLQEVVERAHASGPIERDLLERVRPQLDAFRVFAP